MGNNKSSAETFVSALQNNGVFAALIGDELFIGKFESEPTSSELKGLFQEIKATNPTVAIKIKDRVVSDNVQDLDADQCLYLETDDSGLFSDGSENNSGDEPINEDEEVKVEVNLKTEVNVIVN